MADYIELLRQDLLEQFKDKPVIDALNEAIGEQLNDLRDFFDALKNERSVLTAVGKQLDGVGDIVGLTRMEAGAWACATQPTYVLTDDEYRVFLLFKIWKNTNDCTYYDVMKAFRMFWARPLYYRETPEEPATMILESETLTPEDDARKLLEAPIIKAAGVGIKVIAITENPEMTAVLGVSGEMGRGYMVTTLPEIETGDPLDTAIRPVPIAQNITQTTLPEIKEETT